ncbi:hypothetical protein XENORESO_010149 [Xenotaenia resolanae]|uniref:Uncharacterized protein n=1 Tax=Xenotaenia resolanae TaxID=208358 RepID=A0ABV0VQ16_9TELE
MMPSNTVTNTNSTSYKGSDFVDSPGNRMGESTMLGMDLMEEQRLAFSSASFKVGKPGRKRKQFAVSIDLILHQCLHAYLLYMSD